MNISDIQVVRGPMLRNDVMTVVGVMPAETLVLHHYVPHRSPLVGQGYQRLPSQPRVTGLAGGLRDRQVDLPTSVLLNLRDASKDDVLMQEGPDMYVLRLDPSRASDSHRLFVVDGQHRILALKKAMDDFSVGLQNKKIPFVCMIGANESGEMEQFYIVNSNAKSVPTDLALDLLKARVEHDPDLENRIAERGRLWQVTAQALTELLATTSDTWKDRIRLANMPKGATTVPSASFVRSLRVLLTQTALFRGIKETERQAQVINAYWLAIRRVLPSAFENPAAYSIQKGVGVDVMHSIFPVVIDLARSNSNSLFDPDSYVSALEQALHSLEGPNAEGDTVRGVEFWQTGRKGVAGVYGSDAGKRRLAELLQSLLPEPAL